MTGLDLGGEQQWSLSRFLGYEHPFFFINKTTIIHTWALLVLLAGLCLLARLVLKKNTLARFLVISLVSNFMDLVENALGHFSFKHFCFIISLFFFILFGNTISIIPWLDEPTKDLNTTLALGIASFLYIQFYAITQNGLLTYIKGYFSPFFLMFPVNVIGKLASVVSISFRLFGNIFGGSIIITMYFDLIKGSLLFESVGMLVGLNLLITLFFGLFEGFLQAFVFTMLSLTYLSMALQGKDH
ncbi:MAG: FoF1 ATP synthase subunit a [bacterium]|nr:FoF1 ATP synthase subunit a [bacterium]